MNIQEAKAKDPWLASLSDAEAVEAIQRSFYADLSVEDVGKALGVDMAQARAAQEQAAAEVATPAADRTWSAAVNDTVIEFANAAAGGVSSAANFVKPGNAVSGWIDENFIKPGEASQSDVVKAEKQRMAADLAAAEGASDEVAAVGRYIVNNPVLSAAQAAGSFVGPGLAVKGATTGAKLAGAGAKAVERAGRGGGIAAGAMLAGGDAAGTAHELATQAGATEDEAVAAGRQASVIPALVGGAGGAFGAERLLAGGKGFAGGATARALKTGASEALQEGVEEGITQYEGQRAAVPFDPTIDPSKGVAGAATMGAALGGVTGAGTSVLTHGQPSGPLSRAADRLPRPEPEAEPAPILQLGNQPPEQLISFPDGSVGRVGEMESYLLSLPEEERADARARLMGQVITEVNDPQAQQERRWWENYGDGQPAQPRPDYLAEVQQRIAGGTPFTTQDTVETVRSAMEDAWLAQNVESEPGAAAEAAPQAAEAVGAQLQGEFDQAGDEAALAAVGARVRTSRILSGLQNILDDGADNTVQVLGRLNDGLARIEEAPLAPDEAARVRRMVDAYMGFKGVAEPAPLPSDPRPEPKVQDRAADNAGMEALIPERKAAQKPAVEPRTEGVPPLSPVEAPEAKAKVTEAAQEEVRAPSGNPFKAKLPAINAAKRKGEGWEPVQVEGGWVARKRADGATSLEGRDLGGGWTEYSPESGSLRIPRAEMPQIKAEHRGAMVNFMNARGVPHREESVPAASLKPTQAEFSRDKVAKAKAFEGGNRSILVSGDGHVLDGHHQWMAARDSGEEVKVIRLDAPIRDLVKLAHDFPSSTVSDGGAGAKSNTAPARTPLDHGELNIPGRTNGINAELDRYKAAQAKERKKAAREQSAEFKALKEQARAALDEVGEQMVQSFTRLDHKAARKELQSMVTSRPARLLQMVEKWKGEQAAKQSAKPKAPATEDAKPQEAKAAIETAPEKPTALEATKDQADGVSDIRDLAKQFNDRFDQTGRDVDRTFARVLEQFAGEVKAGRRTRESVEPALARYRELLAIPAKAAKKPVAEEAAPGEDDADAAKFSRSDSPSSAQSQAHARRVQSVAAAIQGKWKNAPEVVVVDSMQDTKVPKAVREADAAQRSQGAEGEPEGFFYDGKVYLVASQVHTAKDVARVLFHEALGHYGLRGVFGKELGAILDHVSGVRRGDVRRKADQYGLDVENAAQRRAAAEEVLAEMAQNTPELGFVKRAVAAIRSWLRQNVPGFEGMAVTDAEIIRDFILPARRFVERGGAAAVDAKAAAFARAPGFNQAVDDVVNAAMKGDPLPRAHVSVGTTSPTLQAAGIPAGNLRTSARVLSKVVFDHGVTKSVLKKLPDLLDSPVMVFESDTVPGSYVAVTSEMVRGLPLIVAISPEQVTGGTSFNFVPSLYPKDDLNAIQRWLKAGHLRYIDKKQSPGWFGSTRLQLPGEFQTAKGLQARNVATDADVVKPDVQFSRAKSARPDAADWQSPSASKWDDLTYKLQDKHIDTKRVLESIRSTGKAIADDLDVYLQEELYHGRAAKRTEDFVTQELEPLMKYMADSELTMPAMEEYLHARHAKEANRVIAERNPDLPDGGSGMTNAEADAVLKSLAPAQRAKLERAAAMVDKIIEGTRQTYVAYGLESQDTVDGWAKTFEHYVPLMREDDDDGMTGLGTGQGFSITGREVKGRTGSTKKVVDILANLTMQRERAIVRGEKNRVAAALMGLAKANPSDFWQVDVVPTQQVLGKDGMVQTQHDPLYKKRDNVVVAKVPELDKKTGKVVVKEHAVVFNKGARGKRMAQALKNLDAAQLEGALGATAKVTRYLAAINTQYNPIFGVTNLARDVQGAALNLASTELAGKQREVLGQTASALAGIYGDERARTKGKGGTGSPWAKLWEEFQRVGGQTGYRDQFRTSADRGQKLAQALDPSAWAETGWGRFFTADGRLKVPMEAVRRAMAPVFAWLDDYNTAMENGVRLAAYKTALDAGLSRERAASLAKNLTTNFNRKGQSAQQVGALYAFFNASVQGTARIGQTLFDMEPGKPKTLRLSATGKKIVAGGVLLGSMQALLLAAAGFDDEEPPDFVRERNLVIPTWGKTYLTIPMPLGFHVLPNLGRIPVEFALGGFSKPAEHVVKLLGLFSDTFNPIGNAGLSMQTLAPTVLDPFAALAENKDFAGRSIAKESFNKHTPGHALARDTSSLPALWISEGINAMSGGTKHVRGVFSPTPDQIDYLVGQVTGGVGREATKAMQTAQALVGGDDLPAHKTLLVGRFYGNADSPSAKQSAFYRNLEEVERHAEQAKGLRLYGQAAEANAYVRSHPQARLAVAARAAQRQVKALRERKREMEQKGAPKAIIRATELQMVKRMEQFNALAAGLSGR